jgi:hypothetical protein
MIGEALAAAYPFSRSGIVRAFTTLEIMFLVAFQSKTSFDFVNRKKKKS